MRRFAYVFAAIVIWVCTVFVGVANAELINQKAGETDKEYIARLESKLNKVTNDNTMLRKRLEAIDKNMAKPADTMPSWTNFRGRPLSQGAFEMYYKAYSANYVVVDGSIVDIGRERAIVEQRPKTERPPTMTMISKGAVQWIGDDATILTVVDSSTVLIRCRQYNRVIKLIGVDTSLLVAGQAVPNAPIIYSGQNSEADGKSYMTFSVARPITREEFATILGDKNAKLTKYVLKKLLPTAMDAETRKTSVSFDGGKTHYEIKQISQ